jgi:D-methionine transport system substrate-binding protein
MKKFVLSIVAFVLITSLVACGGKEEPTTAETSPSAESVTLKVGATAVPHAEILNEVVKPLLDEQGITLDVVIFEDYVLPNTQLADKQLDANYFQHVPWLSKTNEEKGLNLQYITGVHIEPLGIYSNKEKAFASVDQLPEGAKVAITNGQGEHGRVLALLQSAGLLKLKDGVGINGTVADIVESKVELVELAPAMLPRATEDGAIDAAVVNGNFAIQFGFAPSKDSIFLEPGEDNPFVNVLAVREDNKTNDAVQALSDALVSDEVKKFIEEKYNGSVLPVGQKFE